MDIKSAVKTAEKEFYWLHQHPELSGQEFATTDELKRVLRNNNIEIYPLPLATGLVAKIAGKKTGPVVGLRCDIDALPMEEKTDLAYRSCVSGVMHACGHDFHASTLLGVALALADKPLEYGTIKLIFQPGEENASGAKQILATGILGDVDVIFGLHCCAAYDKGTIICRPGAMHGSVDSFKLTFHGKGAHACRPHFAIEPILMIAQYVTAAQALISRSMNPFHSAVLSICHIESGSCANIIPEEGVVEGTLRTTSAEDRVNLKDKILKLGQGIADSYGGEFSYEWESGPPSTNNTAEWAEFAKEKALELRLPFAEAPDSLAGEDFAYYQEKLQGAFIQIGTGIGPMMHNPNFKADPLALEHSITFGVKLVLDALEKIQNERIAKDDRIFSGHEGF